MPEVGIRELKAHASEIMRAVREEGASYVITHRGRPSGILIPYPDESLSVISRQKSKDEVWKRFQRLGEEIGKGWEPGLTTQQVMDEIRR